MQIQFGTFEGRNTARVTIKIPITPGFIPRDMKETPIVENETKDDIKKRRNATIDEAFEFLKETTERVRNMKNLSQPILSPYFLT